MILSGLMKFMKMPLRKWFVYNLLLLVKELIKRKIVVKFLEEEENLGDKKVQHVLDKVLLVLFNG